MPRNSNPSLSSSSGGTTSVGSGNAPDLRRSKRLRTNQPTQSQQQQEQQVPARPQRNHRSNRSNTSSNSEAPPINALSKTPFQAKPKQNNTSSTEPVDNEHESQEAHTNTGSSNSSGSSSKDKSKILTSKTVVVETVMSEDNQDANPAEQLVSRLEPSLIAMIDNCTCGICMDMLAYPVSLLCGHTYCFKCLSEWRKQSVKCPSCRAKCIECYPSLTLRHCITTLVNAPHSNLTESDREIYAKRLSEGDKAYQDYLEHKKHCPHHHHHHDPDDSEYDSDAGSYYDSDNGMFDHALFFHAMHRDMNMWDEMQSNADSDSSSEDGSDSSDSSDSDSDSSSVTGDDAANPIELE